MKELRSAAVPALVAALALLGPGGGPARANEPGASFDCEKAATPVEKTICENEFLGFRDGALDKLYSGLIVNLPKRARAVLRRRQQAWLKARNRACGKVGDSARIDCLNKLYDKRLRRLNRRMRRAGLGPASRGLRPLVGRYVNRGDGFSGSIVVVEVPKGPPWVEIRSDIARGSYICMVSTGQARRRGATLSWRESDEPKCVVSLTFKGRTVRPKATRACRYYCGANGYFDDITYTKNRR